MSAPQSLNFSSLAEMYEGVLAEPLFRPWVNDLFDTLVMQRGCPST